MSFLTWSAEAESVAAAANFYDWESAEQVTTAPKKLRISCLTIARPSDSIIEKPGARLYLNSIRARGRVNIFLADF
jgi:hypothetical protein